MRKFYVYVHTCKANGKKYVGCTTKINPEIRWGKNGEGYKHQVFGKAVRKHGWDNFEHEVFEVESEEEMYRKEVELISFYHSNDPEYGYNCSSGGEKSALGCKYSEEVRQKLSEARKGKHRSEEARKRIAENNRRKAKDPEYRKKLSRPHKPFSEETRKHLSEIRKGKSHKPCSEETKRRISEANRGKHRSEEARKKMSEAKKGKPRSEEARKHLSEIKKGKPLPKIKIKLADGTIVEIAKQHLTRYYINKGKKFEYVSE